MLKKVSVVLYAILLVACVSQPVDKGFKGTGDFDTEEAAKTRVSLGLTYLKNGNFSQAKFNLDKALEFAPRSGQANYALAFYYEQVEEIERAHEYYKKAISLSKQDPDILNSYGAFLCKQGDYNQAKKYFLKSVDDKSYISAASTYENLAICSENQGMIDEAILYFNSALNHQPTRASTLLYLSQLYTQTSRWDEAKKTLRKYERNARLSADSLWLSFQIARGQQDLRAAVEYADFLKRMYPKNPHTKQAMSLLGKFQPDMAVTQKQRPSPPPQYVRQSTSTNTQQPKKMIVEAPVDETPIPNMQSESDNKVLESSNTIDELNDALAESTIGLEDQNKALVESENIVIDSNEIADEVSDTLPATNTNLTEPLVDEVAEDTSIDTKPSSIVDDETELALKNALDKPEALSQNAVNPITINEVEEVSDILDSSTDLSINDGGRFHIVKPKENLYRISLKYNVKIKKLLEWNNLADSSDIRIGTKLWVRDPDLNE